MVFVKTFALPDELVGLIREFSRPLLRYPREYKEALQLLEIPDWPELKAKLSTNDAEQAVVYLQSYLVAFIALEAAAKADTWVGVCGSCKGWPDNGFCCWGCLYLNRQKTYNILTSHL